VEHALQQCGAVFDDNESDDNTSDDIRRAGMVSLAVRGYSSGQPVLFPGRQQALVKTIYLSHVIANLLLRTPIRGADTGKYTGNERGSTR
jgi:hypothetical protein